MEANGTPKPSDMGQGPAAAAPRVNVAFLFGCAARPFVSLNGASLIRVQIKNIDSSTDSMYLRVA